MIDNLCLPCIINTALCEAASVMYLDNSPVRILGFDNEPKLVYVRGKQVINIPDIWVDITLSTGHVISCTHKQRFKVQDKWVAAIDLALGYTLTGGVIDNRPEGIVISYTPHSHRPRQWLFNSGNFTRIAYSPEEQFCNTLMEDVLAVCCMLIRAGQEFTWDNFTTFYCAKFGTTSVRDYIEYHFCSVFPSFVKTCLCPLYGQFVTAIKIYEQQKPVYVPTMCESRYSNKVSNLPLCCLTGLTETKYGTGDSYGFVLTI